MLKIKILHSFFTGFLLIVNEIKKKKKKQVQNILFYEIKMYKSLQYECEEKLPKICKYMQ